MNIGLKCRLRGTEHAARTKQVESKQPTVFWCESFFIFGPFAVK